MPHKVLIVEDEPAIATLVEYNLRRAGFQALVAPDGATALARARSEAPDLVLLDIMLPDMDGRDVLRELRRQGNVPVIFLTARDAEVDRIVGLELGADDYLTKPFSPGELVARVRAVLRRVASIPAAAGTPAPAAGTAAATAVAAGSGTATGAAGGTLAAGDLVLDRARHEVRRGGQEVALTPTEFTLLAYLMENAGLALSREQLLDRVWGADFFGNDRLVDVHIRHLREKLEGDPANPRYILTVRGVGYKFRAEP